MTILLRGSGTAASGTSGNLAPTVPLAGGPVPAIGDLLILHVVYKYLSGGSITTPTGWTLLASASAAAGSAGSGSGSIVSAVYYRIAQGSDGAFTITSTGTNCQRAIIHRFGRHNGTGWDVVAAVAADNTAGAGVSLTTATSIEYRAEDWMLCCLGVNDSAPTWAVTDFTMRHGVVEAPLVSLDSTAIAVGDLARQITYYCPVLGGLGTGAWTMAGTVGSPGANSPAVAGVFVRVREVGLTHRRRSPLVPALSTPARVSLTSGNSTSSGVTASITPAAGALVFAVVQGKGTALPQPTASGCGLTWDVVASVAYSTDLRLTVFRGMGAAPTTGAITFSFGGATVTNYTWHVVSYTSANRTGSNGAGAIRQVASTSVSAATTISNTLAALRDAQSAHVAFLGTVVTSAYTEGNFNMTQIQTQTGQKTAHLTAWNKRTCAPTFASSNAALISVEVLGATSMD